MAGIGAEAVGAQAALVPQARGRLGLALGAMRRLALARDDLERHVEPVRSSRASQTEPEPPLPSGRSGR